MAISVFPAGGGEFITNDFVVDMNNSDNNVVDLGRSYAAGSYDVTLASGDASFDIYALDANESLVGYTNNATLIATDAFTSLVILGVSTTEKITFGFAGASNNATSEGDATGAGAYLESVNPTDLPTIDDTTNVVGGNFATDVEIYFESGAVSTPAKQVARADSQNLIVTRPDQLDPALDPWDVKAINPGVTPPTGSNAHILAGTVDAGAAPTWITTSPLTQGTVNVAYEATVVANDPDGGSIDYAITAGSLPTGLSFDTSTGVISGTPTTGSETITITASDDGGNENSREFNIPILLATGGSISTQGNFIVHTFTSSDDFTALGEITDVQYAVVAGGGGAGASKGNSGGGGGGGAGGYRTSVTGDTSGSATTAEAPISTLTAGTYTVTVGAGGNGGDSNGSNANNGSSSSFSNLVTTVGGGFGQNPQSNLAAGNGGSGGGGGGVGNNTVFSGGSGTSGEGFSGADGGNNSGGGGGGAGSASNSVSGGNGLSSTAAGEIVAPGGDAADGNAASSNGSPGAGGNSADSPGGNTDIRAGASGDPGLVVIRYEG